MTSLNPLLVSAALTMLIAQICKVLLLLLTERQWSPKRLTETGGMPSSHAATVAALCTSCIQHYGINSPYFAISTVYGLIVIYDATGIRRAAGRHAQILNELLKEMSHLFDEKSRPEALKTLLGHTYPQVLVGLSIGISTALIVNKFYS